MAAGNAALVSLQVPLLTRIGGDLAACQHPFGLAARCGLPVRTTESARCNFANSTGIMERHRHPASHHQLCVCGETIVDLEKELIAMFARD